MASIVSTVFRRSILRIAVPSISIRAMSSSSTSANQPQQQGWSSYLWNKVGYETLPQDVANKSFYDLKAALPGKDKWLNMVSQSEDIALQELMQLLVTGGFQGQDRLDYQHRFKVVRITLISLLTRDLISLISGFTPQYKGLQKLHEDYKDRGLVVIGFPCDQFGGQEPGNDEEIMQVCTTLHCQAVADTLLLRPVN
jgi:hypothetical protein